MEIVEDGTVELLNAADIINADDLRYEFVHVPEWSNGRTDTVRVRGLTATERDDWEASMVIGEGKTAKVSVHNIRASLVARCVVDMAGTRVFTDKMVATLGNKSAAAMDRVYAVAAKLTKVSDEDVDNLAGNSVPDHSDDS